MKKIYVYKNKISALQAIANVIINQIKTKNNSVLGFATGSTFIDTYKYLTICNKEISWKNIISFNLDEYISLSKDQEMSYQYFMNKHLFTFVDIKSENIHFPLDNNCDYDLLIKSNNGIDLQLLGIGVNGHIAFNEPGTSFNSKTHITKLTKSTIARNCELFFNNKKELVPKKAITMGLSTIMKSNKIIVAAFGKYKKDVLDKYLKDSKQNINLPLSILKKHPDTTLYIDNNTYQLLNNKKNSPFTFTIKN